MIKQYKNVLKKVNILINNDTTETKYSRLCMISAVILHI